MKATLVYNKSAGQSAGLAPEELLEALEQAGYESVHHPTDNEAELDDILDGVEGLVVSAGGDGTAKAVATRLINNPDAALTILPMGTANNLTKTLEIEGGPLDIIERLEEPRKQNIDLGHVMAPWGEDYFIEGAGLGFFAEVLATYRPDEGKSVLRSIRSIIEVIDEGYGQHTTLSLPEEEATADFLLVEILNTTAVGPRLKFAPNAKTDDGLLHVVCIDKENRSSYFDYLRKLATEEMAALPSVNVYEVPELKIHWHGFPFHIDDYVRPEDFDFRKEDNGVSLRPYPDVPEQATIRVEVIPHALNLWLPACAA